jgi:site-specific DNA-methyltransferase (adenine-specific)
MADKLTWTTEKRRLGDLREWERNPRQLSKHDAEHIKRSMDTFGLADPLIINTDGLLIGGYQRKRIIGNPDVIIDVRVPSRLLTDAEVAELNIRLNKNSGEWDWDILANNFDVPNLIEWGFTENELGIVNLSDSTLPEPGSGEEKQSETTCPKCGFRYAI